MSRHVKVVYRMSSPSAGVVWCGSSHGVSHGILSCVLWRRVEQVREQMVLQQMVLHDLSLCLERQGT